MGRSPRHTVVVATRTQRWVMADPRSRRRATGPAGPIARSPSYKSSDARRKSQPRRWHIPGETNSATICQMLPDSRSPYCAERRRRSALTPTQQAILTGPVRHHPRVAQATRSAVRRPCRRSIRWTDSGPLGSRGDARDAPARGRAHVLYRRGEVHRAPGWP